MITAENRNGPRKLKSWPLEAAQKVYRVRLTTTTAVRITDSRITFPAHQVDLHVNLVGKCVKKKDVFLGTAGVGACQPDGEADGDRKNSEQNKI